MTPNQLWKSSGSSLSFKDWMNREKEKQGLSADEKLDMNATFNKGIQETIDNYANASGPDTTALPYKPDPSGNNILGINRTVLIVSGVLIVAAVGYHFYKKKSGK